MIPIVFRGEVQQMETKRILFVEDEENLLNSFSFILENAGYQVVKASNGEQALASAFENTPDLVILDVGLPGMDGHAVAKKMRENPAMKKTPVIMLTGRNSEEEIIKALETSADDYICKPVKPRMLLARISSILRRTEKSSEKNIQETITAGDISLDPSARSVIVEGISVKLTRSEFDILQLLIGSPERVFSRDRIISATKGDDFFITERSIDFLISGLRKKLGKSGEMIVTVRGIGFKITSGKDQ